jgi:hypothetical protein
MQSSCVNNEIKSFSRKLLKHAKAHKHVTILEISDDRKLFTTQGLHLNGLGKDKLAKQIVSLTYTILDQKKDPTIILSWNSDQSHSDTLHQGNVNRVSTRTKKTPSNKYNDFLWETQTTMWEWKLALDTCDRKRTGTTTQLANLIQAHFISKFSIRI